jgi:hypothetical protein
LYVNLRGFDPAGPTMSPADALRKFLDVWLAQALGSDRREQTIAAMASIEDLDRADPAVVQARNRINFPYPPVLDLDVLLA